MKEEYDVNNYKLHIQGIIQEIIELGMSRKNYP